MIDRFSRKRVMCLYAHDPVVACGTDGDESFRREMRPMRAGAPACAIAVSARSSASSSTAHKWQKTEGRGPAATLCLALVHPAIRLSRCECGADCQTAPGGALHPAIDLFRVTAARMRAFNASSSIFSPSWKSMARLVFPSRLALKRPERSFRAAPLAKVIFTTFL
jgi:hypothetical protein